LGTPPTPRTMQFLGGKGGYFEKLSNGSKTLDMTSEVFEGDSADTCAKKFPLMSMGGRANGQACAECERGPPSARAEFYQPDLDLTETILDIAKCILFGMLCPSAQTFIIGTSCQNHGFCL
jgi:hypothetical protein